MTTLIRGLITSLCVIQAAFCLDFDLTSHMPMIITNVNLSHYDIAQNGKGPAMFTIHMRGDEQTHEALDMMFEIFVESPVLAGGKQLVFQGLSTRFEMAPMENTFVQSNQFMQLNPTVPCKFHRAKTLFSLDNDALQNKVVDGGKIPTGYLWYTMTLRQNGQPIISKSLQREIINVSRVEPLFPGTNAADGDYAKVYSPYPLFSWMSDLNNPALYGGEDIFELKIYKQEENYSAQEALVTKPVYTIRTTQTSAEYPINAKSLEPGCSYVWQVKAFLKGIIDAEMLSEPYGFTYVSNSGSADPQVTQIFDDLIILLSSEYPTIAEELTQMKSQYASKAIIKSGSGVETPMYLNDLKRRILSGEFELTTTPVVE